MEDPTISEKSDASNRPISARNPKPKKKPRYVPTTAKQLHVAKLIGDANLTDDQRAAIAGVSRGTVTVTRKRLNAILDTKAELLSYRTILGNAVSHHDCSKALRKVIVEKVDTNPFAALRGIEIRDKILGLVDRQEQQQPVLQPLFVLPADAEIRVRRSSIGDAPKPIDLSADQSGAYSSSDVHEQCDDKGKP